MFDGRESPPVSTVAFLVLLSTSALTDLPLVEVAAHGAPSPAMAVLISGDGGWAAIDKSIANALAARGIPVVGINSLQYFWRERKPEEIASDLTRVIAAYRAKWQRGEVVLIGYSRGADVLPFAVPRMNADMRRTIRLVALLAPSTEATFQFHMSDWLRDPHGAPTLPEARKLRGMRVLCVHGDAETDSLCPQLDAGLARDLTLHGGHHFDGKYGAIAARILEEMK
jgi:type IV secretory pathway VirJ component